MDSYRYEERAAPSGLSTALDCLWTGAGEPPADRVQRVVPDGCTDLIWTAATSSLVVAGPDTQPHFEPIRTGLMVAVRFRPGFGPGVFGVPAHALRDQRVPLEDLWPAAEAARLGDLLAAAGSESEMDSHLVGAVRGRLRAGAPDPAVAAITDAVRAAADVRTIADDIGVGERQLHRRCLAAFGYGPKVLHRVLRFQRAMSLAYQGVPFAEVATSAGYADQAHLSREVKALAGAPLGELVGVSGDP